VVVKNDIERMFCMKSILKELFDGNVYPSELIVPKSSQYHETNQKISDEQDYFKGKLSEDDRKRLEELGNLYCQSTDIDSFESFSYGFKLGVMLMVEVFTGKDDLARGGGQSE